MCENGKDAPGALLTKPVTFLTLIFIALRLWNTTMCRTLDCIPDVMSFNLTQKLFDVLVFPCP